MKGKNMRRENRAKKAYGANKANKPYNTKNTITVSGIEIEVSKKRIKNMYLRVSGHDGRVRISAPLRTRDEDICRFARSRAYWIKKQLGRYKERASMQQRYGDGEIIYLWGIPYVLRINEGNRNKAEILGNTVIVTVKGEADERRLEKIILELHRIKLKEMLPGLFDKWERIIGVHADAVSVRNMKSRWGSCKTVDKKICINLQLAKKPVIFLEYVIVHELVHLLEHSHNAVFKGYMDRYMPNWREIRKALLK